MQNEPQTAALRNERLSRISDNDREEETRCGVRKSFETTMNPGTPMHETSASRLEFYDQNNVTLKFPMAETLDDPQYRLLNL